MDHLLGILAQGVLELFLNGKVKVTLKIFLKDLKSLLAVIESLEFLKKTPSNVTVFSDSKYVIDSVQKKWLFKWEKNKFKGKKNTDLWQRFLLVYRKHNVNFKWIKGHNNHPQNEYCDKIAAEAAKSNNLFNDYFFENELKSKQ